MDIFEKDRLDSIFVIEALRSGIPSRLSTRSLPDLRKKLTDKVKSDLESFDEENIPMGKIIWGQYGQGKTHVLTTAEHIALDLNFAVSRVSLSREVSCHNLFKFYTKVAPRIKTPDSNTFGIQRILLRKSREELAEDKILSKDRYMHFLPQYIFEDYYYSTGADQDKLYNDLMGIRVPVTEFKKIHKIYHPELALPKFETFKETKHAEAYFGLMADVLKFCGYKGWVLLIDEIELIGRLGKVSRLKAYLNLAWLMNWFSEMKYPIYTICAAATRLQDDIWFGKKNNDRDIMPELAENRYGIKERNIIKDFFKKAIDDNSLTIVPATFGDLVNLLNKIISLHEEAYRWKSDFNSETLINSLGSQTVRTYIRGTLESLDLAYLYKEKVKVDTAELIEESLEEDSGFFVEDEKES
ncbi:MAG: BREX system ATP-binding domain-containing protein [Candidatus Humimicrobiaceae bacterium]